MRVTKTQHAFDETLPRRVCQAVDRYDGTIVQLCAKADISPTFLYGLMNGGVGGMSYETLRRIAKVLGVDDCFGVKFPD